MTNNEADIRTVEHTSIDEETVMMEVMAKQTAETLVKHYPSHLWAIGWAPGMTLVVRNMAIPGNYGYTVDASKIATASELAHLAMLAGGELLERCGVRRGEWDGQFFTRVEGADPKHLNPI